MTRPSLAAFLFTVLLTAASVQPTSASTPQDQPTKDPGSVQVLASMNAACGWNGLLPANALATGMATTPDGKSEQVILKAKPGWLRIERPQSNIVLVSEGPFGSISADGKSELLSGSEAASIHPLMFPFYTEMAAANDPTLSVGVAKNQTLAGASVQTIALASVANLGDNSDSVRQAASAMSVSISTKDSFPVLVRFRRMAKDTINAGIDVDAYLSDYRKVDDVLVPFHYEEWSNGQLIFSIQFDSVAFNVVPDSDFILY